MEAFAGSYFCYPLQLFSHSGAPGNRICGEYGGKGTDCAGPCNIATARYFRRANQYCQNAEIGYSQLRYSGKKIHPEIECLTDQSFGKKVAISGITLLVLAIIGGIFMFLMRQTIIVMSRHIEFDQKNEIYQHYQQLDTSFYKSHSTGDLMSRMAEDVSRVRMYTGPAIMYLANLLATIGFSLYFMIRKDALLTLYVLAPLPILAVTIYLVNNIIHKKSERIQALLSNLTTNAQESYSGIRVIKSFVQESAMFRFFTC